MEMEKSKSHPIRRLLAHMAVMTGIVLALLWMNFITDDKIIPVCVGYTVLQLVIYLFRRRMVPRWLLAAGVCLVWAGSTWFFSSEQAQETKNRIPESLQVFRDKYPEAQEFVDSYPTMKDMDFSMDVSEEVEKGVIPLFIQWDERWGYRSYGEDYFGTSGCGPACLSMIVCGLTGDAEYNPYEVGRYAEKMGWILSGGGTAWDLMTRGAEHFGLNARKESISRERILENLADGRPMICSMKPGDFTYTGHFIVLTGMDEEGLITVNDPNSRRNSEKHWELEVLVPQIKGLWSYSYI